MPQIDREDPQVNVMRRLTFGATLSKTKSSAVCCDDDFYTASGLLESLKILASQDVLDAVVGRVLTYERKRNLYWHHKYVPRTNRTDLESDSIKQKLFTGSSWFLYAVCKTHIWQKFLLTCFEEKKFTSTNFYTDWTVQLLSKAMFRTKYIDIIQSVRQDTIIGANKGPVVPWNEFICDKKNVEIIDEIVMQLASGFNVVTSESEHVNNFQLAQEQIRLEQEKSVSATMKLSRKKRLRRVMGNIFFFFSPSLSIFSDRPRRLKYLWRIPKYQYSAEQQREVERIEKLLLMARDELRLRANF